MRLLATFLIAALTFGAAVPSAGADPSTPNVTWSAVDIGGGGFVTGLIVGPDGALVARTDVGGAYHRPVGAADWRSLTTTDRVAEPERADHNVVAVAVAPSDPSTIYQAVGNDNDDGRGRVLSSHDGGATFASSQTRWSLNGNDGSRRTGERLAVDPRHPDTVWLGVQDGLWRSIDGGLSWSELSSVPGVNDPTSPGGVTVVVVDDDGPVDAAGRALGLWIGVEDIGVLRTDDGGATWRTVVPLSRGWVVEIERDAVGELVVLADGPGREPLLWRLAGETVTDIEPPADVDLRTVAVDPANPQRLFLSEPGMQDRRLWRSLDGGATWTKLMIDITSPEVAWPEHTTLEGWMSAGELVFGHDGTLWFAEGMGIWHSRDLDDDEVTWTFDSAGIEELVSNDAVKVPGGPLVTAHWDRGLMVHDGEPLPARPEFGSAWSIATTPANPDRLAAVLDNHQRVDDPKPHHRQSATSVDGGRTWQRMGSLVDGTHPDELKFGNIAISSTDPDLLVWAPSDGGRVHRSTDGGDSWTASGTQPDGVFFWRHYLHRHALVADPVDGATFYVLSDAGLHRTTDGAVTWHKMASEDLPGWANVYNVTLRAVPGRSGELFMSAGQLSGNAERPLMRSRDGGASWEALWSVPDAGPFDLGAPVSPGGDPVLWVETRDEDGKRLIARSEDLGDSIDIISSYPIGRYDRLFVVEADTEDPWNVYLGYAGTGFVRGHAAEGVPFSARGPFGVTHRPGIAGANGPVGVDVRTGQALPLATGASDARRVVAAAQRIGATGTWATDDRGKMFVTGDVAHHGDLAGVGLKAPVLAMSPTASGNGYWMAAADGGVFAFGDAAFHGSLGSIVLNRPITAMSVTPGGRGYHLVASDGGVFAFGDARFVGSLGSVPLRRPVTGMATTPTGDGYWLVAADGGVFAFGDAPYVGGLARAGGSDVVGIVASDSGRGYWLVDADGRSHPFGDAASR